MTFWIVKLTDLAQDTPAPGIPPRHLSDPCFFQAEADTADEAIAIAMNAFEGAFANATAELDELNNDPSII